MNQGFPTEEVKEGAARILVPRLDKSTGEPVQRLQSQAPVFYNPVQKTNRDTAVLALRVHQSNVKRPLRVCEPMCGSGVRGIRLALEVPEVERVVMGDLSPSAIALAGENAKLNEVIGKVNLRLLDANLLMSLHGYPGGRFDYVDIDPYGSPSTFIDSGLIATRNHGLIALTATDMAPLCGVNPKACLRKYGGKPLQGEFCHEVALRLLAGLLVRQTAIQETAATPVFSYYADHYIRLYARVDKGAKRADALLEQMGFIKFCPECLHRFTSMDNKPENCILCGSQMRVGGPLWLGELAEEGFVSGMLEESYKLDHFAGSKAVNLVESVRDEIGFPVSFFIIDNICSIAKIKSMSTEEAIKRIKSAGFRVTMAHYDDRAIKTDASVKELEKVLGG
ncbi:MAG: tRNA (guanine(10)-N(2))-dimethyltransferase [Candidatus Bathyarchaeota archaeon]|nr:tRNA (guanine(10)-N(2))-dimethyltransferase [Candidatus Bathyarchaeota archaeon]